MTKCKQIVKDICDEIYIKFPEQILIDFIQDEVEDLLNKQNDDCSDAAPTSDEVGALSYQCSIMLDVYDKNFVWDIDVLNRLRKALKEWGRDIEATNIILGIPKES